ARVGRRRGAASPELRQCDVRALLGPLFFEVNFQGVFGMKLGSTNLLRAIGAGVMSAALCSAAAGQTSGFDKPLKNKAKETQPEGGSRSTMRMREDDGENSYELTIQDDEVSAK